MRKKLLPAGGNFFVAGSRFHKGEMVRKSVRFSVKPQRIFAENLQKVCETFL